MSQIHIDLFTSLDLVGQGPGGRSEDPSNGFRFSGWQAPVSDDIVGEHVWAAMAGMDALLLGRRTYDIFAGYWPRQEDGAHSPIARLFNGIPKYVASRGRPDLSWAGSTLLGADLPAAIRAVRDRHENIHVIGSLNLVQTLLRERLFDRLNLWVFPVVLGGGKKLFDGGEIPANLSLAEPAITSPKGAVRLCYALHEGEPAVGDIGVGAD